jgi:hypothetical protein
LWNFEVTGGYLIGRDKKMAKQKGTSIKAFETFIERYMPSYQVYVSDLWKFFRNGLAHGFYISKGGIELNLPQKIQRTGSNETQINGDEFVNSFAIGFSKCVEDFKRMPSGSKMRNRFDKAWGWVFLS